MVKSLEERGFTNITEADLRRDIGIWFTNMFTVHAGLPGRISDWPEPRSSKSNEWGQVSAFVARHGWSMSQGEVFFLAGVRTEPITDLPWPEINALTFPAVTRDGILYVVLRGFGSECGGVAWNPKTNRFDAMIGWFHPLGRGWYSWSQGHSPSSSDDRRYEGNVKNSEPNERQPFR
jgi:hypothetical protein